MGESNELEADLERMTRTELREKYKLTYESWKNGKSRAKIKGHWAEEFDDFKDFLRIMGPRPAKEHTLDRTDNMNPRYGPGLCKWEPRRVQNNNRRTTILIGHHGEKRPLTHHATEMEVSASRIRRAFQRGAFDTSGWKLGEPSKDGSPFGRDPRLYQPWPYRDQPDARSAWEKDYKQHASPGENRFEFLSRRLARLISRVQRKLDEQLFDPEEDIEEFRQAERARIAYHEGKKQYQLWLKETKKADLFRARQNDPLFDWKKRMRDDGDD